MNTTETQNRQGSRDKAAGDNVVRLPRDWLGPREDLVPFGPSAYGDGSEPVTELPRNADDFWGGADPQEIGSEPTSGPAAEQQRRWSLPSLPRVRVRLGLSTRAAVLVSLGALGILVAVGLVLLVAGGHQSSSGRLVASSNHASSNTAAFDARATYLRNAAAHVSRVRARHAAGVSRHASVRRRAAPRRRDRPSARSHHHHRSAPTVQAVTYTGSSSGATSDSTGSSSVSSAPASDPAAPATSSSPATSSPSPNTASSPSTGSPSSSSNQPAIGANGTLGPGSSPDG